MALLLAMYQKLRLIRQKNQLTLDLTKYSSKLDRVTKNIERVNKRYTSLFAQLDSQAKMMQSNATVMFQNMAGLGTNSVNLNNYSGMNGFVYGTMQQMFNSPFKYKDNNDTTQELPLGQDLFKRMYTEYMSNGGRFLPELDADKKQVYDEQNNPKYKNFSYLEVQAFTQAQQAASMQQQQAQMWVQNANQNYGNNVSIWLEAAKAQLEAEQDAALEPLSYEETMMELEKTQTDAKLKRVNEQIETYDQLVQQESEKTAPTFGLR